MEKEKKNVENSENQELDSVNSIIAEDMNNIEDATQEALKNVDSIALADNLKDVKSTENTENNDNNNDNNETNEEKNNTEPESIPKKKKNHKTLIIIVSIVIAILLLLLLFSTIFALITKNSSTIINGVKVKEIDISGLNKPDAINILNNAFDNKLSKTITLKHNEYKIDVTPKQLDVKFDIEGTVDLAYNKGRSDNIFKDNFDIIITMLSPTQINPGFSYNEETLNSLVKEMEENFSDHLIESSYYIDGNELVLSRGKDGVVVDIDELKKQIIYNITNIDSNSIEIEIPVQHKKASPLDLNKIYKEVAREPKDAYYTTDPYVVYPHEDGIDFEISLEEAISGYNNNTEETYTIPLTLIAPAVTTSQIGTEAFPDELGAFSTTYNSGNTNRSTNIRLASQKIDGTVVMPGEVFSYNATVGQRTAAAGFKTAAVYSGGEVTTGIGGGICQVSSTLYNAVLLSNLEIVERYNHGFNPGYVAVGRDATVSWGGPDFKFKNNRDYPVKISCSGTGGKIIVQIFGLLKEDEYDVEIESYVTRWISYSTITREDSSLSSGETRVIESGSNGCKSVAYRILKKDGEVVEKELLSQDTYSPHNRIVAVGTGD